MRVCRERGVKVMVDGAHSPGQLPLNMKDLGAEYFTGIIIACGQTVRVLNPMETLSLSDSR